LGPSAAGRGTRGGLGTKAMRITGKGRYLQPLTINVENWYRSGSSRQPGLSAERFTRLLGYSDLEIEPIDLVGHQPLERPQVAVADSVLLE
jgi:hypothetical protein